MMAAYAWLMVLLALGLAVAGWLGTADARHGSLPQHFDFARYKNRELCLRGLFDKTKWR